jgi:hypothetical protein
MRLPWRRRTPDAAGSAWERGVGDALVLARLLAERIELQGGSAADVRAELEQTWIEATFVAADNELEVASWR